MRGTCTPWEHSGSKSVVNITVQVQANRIGMGFVGKLLVIVNDMES